MFQKCKLYLKILRTRRVTQSKLHTENTHNYNYNYKCNDPGALTADMCTPLTTKTMFLHTQFRAIRINSSKTRRSVLVMRM